MRRNQKFGKMKFISKFSLILLLYIAIDPSIADIKVLENHGVLDMQQSVSKCILSIANEYFSFGSNVGIISSNFHNKTNRIMTRNTYNVITATVMTEMRWAIVVKDGSTYVDDVRTVRSCC